MAFCRACSASTPPTWSSSPARRSSSATVTVSTGAPVEYSARIASKMCWWAGLVEVVGPQALLADRPDRLARQQHRPEHRLLGLQVVRRHRPAAAARSPLVVRRSSRRSIRPPSQGDHVGTPVGNKEFCGPASDLCGRSCGHRQARSTWPGRDDVDRDRERHVGVQLGRDGVLTERLDRVAVQLSAIELDTGLLAHRVDDVGGGDRAEQLPLGAGLGGDRDHLGHERGGDGLRRLPVAGVAQVAGRRIFAAWSTAPAWPRRPGPWAAGSCGRSRRRHRRCRRACRGRRGRSAG